VRPTTRAGLRASALLVPAVLAVVLGILGMHGLSTHGATAAGTPLVDTAPAAASGHATSHPTDHAAGHPTGPSSGPAADHADQHDHGGAGSTVMLCVAMLVAAAATLVTLLVRRSWPALTRAAQAPCARRSHPRPALLRIGTGPPVAWRFSVVRC
jgi:hypothetical protein